MTLDFGFIFDIAPGGGLLEKAPFKLTSEMIQVMGGNSDQQPFKQFSELVVKGYLASRPYAELIMQLVKPMLESGLPCFKGDTIRRLQTRFQIDKSDREAADFMIQRIRDSFENQRTVIYDYFQKITNGKLKENELVPSLYVINLLFFISRYPLLTPIR